MPRSLPRLLVLLLALGCGRSSIYQPVPPKTCALQLDDDSLDFGSVAPGAVVTRQLGVTNVGMFTCRLSSIAVSDGTGFTRTAETPTDTTIAPGASVSLGVQFSGTGMPFERVGSLTFESTDAQHVIVDIPLHAHLKHCALSANPAAIEFSPVLPGAVAMQSSSLVNTGDARCVITSVALDGDPAFSAPALPMTFELMPGDTHALPAVFTAPATLPTERMGRLLLTEMSLPDPVIVTLDAFIELCAVTPSPDPFDFGNVLLNTTQTHTLTFSNTGTATCVLSAFVLTADPTFSLPTPPGTLTIPPGGNAGLAIRFDAFDSAPPHLRTGTLAFTSNDPSQLHGTVPVSGFINTICTEAGQFIYTVDSNNTFSRFDPATLTSTPIGQLDCPVASMVFPFSMNLDQSAVAWVVFDDGNLFKVDISNAHCTATSFVPGQGGFTSLGFGMGSVFDSATGKDTLFITDDNNPSTLATLDLSTLVVSPIGPIEAFNSEVSGTGDGQLWLFTPGEAFPSGGVSFLIRVDPITGVTLEHHDLPSLTEDNSGYAIKFWGGAFYIFLGTDVWKVPRNTLLPTQNLPTSPPTLVFTDPTLNVVGAGVSTCAPVMGQ